MIMPMSAASSPTAKTLPRLPATRALLRDIPLVAEWFSTTMAGVVRENHRPKMTPGTTNSMNPSAFTNVMHIMAAINVTDLGRINR